MLLHFSVALTLFALLERFQLLNGYLHNDEELNLNVKHVEKWQSVTTRGSYVRALPSRNANRSGSDAIPKHPLQDFETLHFAKGIDKSLRDCFYKTLEDSKRIGDLDLVLKTAAGCLIENSYDVGKLEEFSLIGHMNGMTEKYYKKYRTRLEFGHEHRTSLSVSYKDISDGNYMIVKFDNKLKNETLQGSFSYTVRDTFGLMKSTTKSSSNLVSASLKINCRMDNDQETSESTTESKTEETSTTTVPGKTINVPPGQILQLSYMPQTRVETKKIVQPVYLSGYIGVATYKLQDKQIQRFLVPVRELSTYFPDFFLPYEEDKVKFNLVDFASFSFFYPVAPTVPVRQ